jgi:glycerate-2-kinase
MENILFFKTIAIDIFNAAIEAVDPYKLSTYYSDYVLETYNKEHCNKLNLIGFGKAAFPMAKALGDTIPEIVTTGIIITKYGHVKGTLNNNIEIFEAGHPIPDKNGLIATKKVIDMLKGTDTRDLVLCLVSGGGSALLAAPSNGISLSEKQQTTELLLKSGADINELNAVRKHISAIKGGRLAEIAYPSRVISLILSDVIGDPLDVIASGPTSPDNTTYVDAFAVINKYQLRDKIPENIMSLLQDGVKGAINDTPKIGNPVFEKVKNIIIGSNKIATKAAAKKANELGFDAMILTTELSGDAKEAAKWLAGEALKVRNEKCVAQNKMICLVSGGETTVNVKGNGLGGRNMELALAFAIEIEGTEGITLVSAGTDGTDGPTDAAGAVVDGQTIEKACKIGLDPDSFLENNDSYTFFKHTGEILITGSTGTNVMDIQVILITR